MPFNIYDPKEDVVEVDKTELQHKHQFHFKEFYKMTHDWFEDNGYKSEGGSDDYENFFMERHLDGGVREVRYWWHLFKSPHDNTLEDGAGKNLPFVRFHLAFRIRTLGLKDVEVAYGSRKVRVQDGEMSVIFNQQMIIDYSLLRKNWLGNILYDYYKKRWYKAYHEQYKKMAYIDSQNLQNTVKRWLNWYQYSLVPKPLRPSVGGYRAKSEFEK